MIIDFTEMEEKAITSFKGGEKVFNVKMFDDNNCKIMRGRLEPGASIGVHTHEDNSEIVFIIEGSGTVYYDGVYKTVKAGQCHYCPKGHEHSLINNGTANLLFYAVVPQQ